jgi:molecular chaperone GrpE
MSEDKKHVEEMEPKSIDIEVNQTTSSESDKIIKTYEKKLSDYDEKLQLALADYQNLERRTRVEISQRVSDKINGLLLNFINIYEDFIRAENALSKENVNTNGINAVIKNMENLLAENNIKSIDAVGEIFDPQIHEAVSMVEDDTLDDGTIIQEVAKGYISEKGILKPSKVIVSKKKEMEKKV